MAALQAMLEPTAPQPCSAAGRPAVWEANCEIAACLTAERKAGVALFQASGEELDAPSQVLQYACLQDSRDFWSGSTRTNSLPGDWEAGVCCAPG